MPDPNVLKPFRKLLTTRQRPVAHLLSGLVLVCLLPGFLGSCGFLLNEYREERERQGEDMRQLARNTGLAVDAHLQHVQALVRTLANTQLHAGDGAGLFSAQAARVIADALGMPAKVYRFDGERVLVASSRDDRHVPGPREMQDLLAVFGSGAARVSDLAADEESNVAIVTIHVPIPVGGKVAYSVAVAVPAAQLTEVLVQRHLPEGWLASILDRDGLIAARNRWASRYTGLPAMDGLRLAVAAQASGSLDTVTRDGVENFTVFARSPRTGYTTIVGVPRDKVVGPLAARLAGLAAAIGGLFVLGLFLAHRMSRRISGSIQALIEPATALGRGTIPAPPAVQVAETAEVGAALQRAAFLLRDRDAALRAQQEELQRFKFVSENANEMLLLLDEAGNIRYANRMTATRLGYGNAELLAMSLFEIDLPTRPERLRYVFEQCREAPVPAFERVYTCKDGTCIPVEITATILDIQGEWLMHVAARDIGERHQAEQAMRWAASHDGLTGLANRSAALAALEQALACSREGGAAGALLFIDLNRFKPVNDYYGHEVGDRVLQEVARRMQACLDTGNLLARAGGDEFLVLMPLAGAGTDPAEALARKLIAVVTEPITDGIIEVALSASIGISRFPEHGDTASLVIHTADMAMLQVKQSRRPGFAWYSPHMDACAQFTLNVERRLQHALEHDGLALHYQPIIDLATGTVTGVEALVRLEDGIMPAVGPAAFIPIAESTGLIAGLGEWVKRAACRQQVAWQADGMPLTVSVNVSALQFRRPGFPQRIHDLIASTGIAPGQLVIELTESAIIENVAEAVAILHEVKALGVRVALDDFGTGYSSLSSLSTLPLDKLKIDQSFVRRIDSDDASRAVIDAVIALGHSLRLELVAEGIETEAARDYLRDRGCQLGQGYWFSRPLAGPQLEAWWARTPG